MKTGKPAKYVVGQSAPKTTLHKNNRKEAQKQSAFSVIFTSALGGGSIGSFFGVPGVLLGTAIGGGIGAVIQRANG